MPFKEITTYFGFLRSKIALIPQRKEIKNENRRSIDGRTEAIVNYQVYIRDDRTIKVEQNFIDGTGKMITEILHDQEANHFLENFDQQEGRWKKMIRWEQK